VYVGAHCPGNVFAGLVFGAPIAIAGLYFADRVLAPFIGRILAAPIGRRFATTGI
jgi:membrane-associated phospholipid phosphatase